MDDSDTETSKLRHTGEHTDDCLEIEKELVDETTCGYGPFKGALLQKLATKNMYVFVFGIVGLFSSASWAYYNGTINTIEKRFKIPSKAIGYMNVATNSSQLFMSTVLGYWAGRGHRPRWIAVSIICYIIQMLLYILPHIIYGPGEEALSYTMEYSTNWSNISLNQENSGLCHSEEECLDVKGSFVQPAILFVARFIGGLGGGLFHTAGVAYIDDNVKKEDSPFLISLSYFIRMMGPSLGYAIAAACLQHYVSPWLTPVITKEDPRWIGAWWSGYIFFIIIISLLTIPLSLFPKTLPAIALKRRAMKKQEVPPPPSFRDLIVTTKRLLSNKIYTFNTIAAIAYILGESPFWMFLAKYMEAQYRLSASKANFITGTVSLTTSATGLLLSGVIVGRLRPSARSLAAWNVFVAALSSCGYIAYIFISCENQLLVDNSFRINTTMQCNAHCGCDHVPYSPVCSDDNEMFISPCHAGCLTKELLNGSQIYQNCSCTSSGTATGGLCPSDCSGALTWFLVIMGIIELAASSGVLSNSLLGMRCVDEKDKSAAMGLTLTLCGVFGFGPAPVLYGYLLDMTCVLWGKTCTGTGNCWLYNGPHLAYFMNLTAAVFVSIGTICDAAVWYYSRDLVMFN